MLATLNPIPQYFDLDGNPLNNGEIFFGVANLNPMTNPIAIYWDAAGTQPAAQPAKTLNGFPVRNGTPTVVYVAGAYSIVIKDKKGRQVLYAPNSVDFGNAASLQAMIDVISQDFARLSSVSSASDNAAIVGFAPNLDYLIGNLGFATREIMRDVSIFLTDDEATQVRTGGVSINLQPAIVLAKTWGGDKALRLSAGGWAASTVDFKGWYGGLYGDGMTATTVKATAAAAAIDAADTTDVVVSPFRLSDLMIDGQGTATIGVNMRYRHHAVMENLYISNMVASGVDAIDTFLSGSDNVRITACPIGMRLRGSNHASKHSSLTITNCSTTGLLIESLGTAMDGNDALEFDNLRVTDASGYGIKDGGTSTTYVSPYIGENLQNTVFTKSGTGVAVIEGGVLFYGNTAATYAFEVISGLTTVRGLKINGQSYGGIGNLIKGSGGTITLEKCSFNFPLGGDQVFDGNPIGYGPSYECFAPKYGKAYTATAVNCTVETIDAAPNQRIWTVTAVAGGTQTVHISAALINRAAWVEGAAFILATYYSTVDWNMRLGVDNVGTSPIKPLGALLDTEALQKTYLKLDATLDGGAYTLIEFYNDAIVLGASLTIVDFQFTDSRGMPIGNIYK